MKEKIDRLQKVLGSTETLTKIGLIVVQQAALAFRDPSKRVTPWPPRKKETGKPLLVKKGLLKRSVRLISAAGGRIVVGSDRAYAAIHQFGGRAGRGRKVSIPARPYFPIKNDQLGQQVSELITRSITRLLSLH